MMIHPKTLFVLFSIVVGTTVWAQDQDGAQPCAGPMCLVAERGSAQVTVADIQAKLNLLEPEQQDALLSDPKQINKMVENLLIMRQFSHLVDPAVKQSDVIIRARLQQVEDEVLGVYQLDKIRRERLPANYDRLAQESYRAQKAAMKTPTQALVRHLLIDTSKHTEAEAQAKIEALAAELKGADQERFSKITIEQSEDPSKTSNGGLIEAREDSNDLDASFLAGALALKKVGEISPPIRSSYGFHLLQLIQTTPSRALSFEDVKPQIVKKLREEAARRVTVEYRAEVMASGETKFYSENLKALIFGDNPPPK